MNNVKREKWFRKNGRFLCARVCVCVCVRECVCARARAKSKKKMNLLHPFFLLFYELMFLRSLDVLGQFFVKRSITNNNTIIIDIIKILKNKKRSIHFLYLAGL